METTFGDEGAFAGTPLKFIMKANSATVIIENLFFMKFNFDLLGIADKIFSRCQTFFIKLFCQTLVLSANSCKRSKAFLNIFQHLLMLL